MFEELEPTLIPAIFLSEGDKKKTPESLAKLMTILTGYHSVFSKEQKLDSNLVFQIFR